MTSIQPTPNLDAFLAAYAENDNEWWYLSGGDHLNLFDDLLDRLATTEAHLAAARSALAACREVAAKRAER